jgi:hypothetical protein
MSMPEDEAPTGWRAWFPPMEERAARRRARLEALADTDSVRARVEIAIGALTIAAVVVAVVVVIVVHVVR